MQSVNCTRRKKTSTTGQASVIARCPPLLKRQRPDNRPERNVPRSLEKRKGARDPRQLLLTSREVMVYWKPGASKQSSRPSAVSPWGYMRKPTVRWLEPGSATSWP